MKTPAAPTSAEVATRMAKPPRSGSELLFVGVDIGGTKVAAGLVNNLGQIVFKTRTEMVTSGGAMAGFAAVAGVIDETIDVAGRSDIAAIGVSSPGAVDPATGVVSHAINIPAWHDFPLRNELSRTYKLPICVDNDANAAGLAEALWGTATGYDSVFYASFGTGIGTAIILGHTVYRGVTGAAGEGGHMCIDYSGELSCPCGKPGCVEAMASGPAIARRAQAKVAADSRRSSALLRLAHGNPAGITSEIVGTAWRSGDALAAEVLSETAEILAVWFGNIVDLLEPEVIIVGGGLGDLLSHFFSDIAAKLPKWSINKHCREIPMKVARYGADSGIAGGAALCLTHLFSQSKYSTITPKLAQNQRSSG
jgi:glucokinase